jgi:hypothetical protein
MFDSITLKDARSIALLKKAILVLLAIFLCIGIISSHRAYYQVRSLELDAPEKVLHGGSTVKALVISSGRTYVDLQVEMIQGARAETLAVQRVPSNEYGFFDPRTQQAALTVVFTPEMLARFQRGPAQVRATAFGHSQWTRTPPPVVREIAVEIQHD